MSKLLKYVKGLKVKYFYKEKVYNVKLFGQELKLIKGTLQKVDYDDAWFYYLAKESKVLFDIGANIGYTSLLAALAGKLDRIVLVDPNTEALAWAVKNLLRNRLIDNCIFNTSLITDKVGDHVRFYTSGAGAAGSIFKDQAETAKIFNESIWVFTQTVDALVAQYNLVPDLIKIDVEGAEVTVLNGAVSLARLNKTRFMVEMHSNPDLPMIKNAEMVLEWCNSNGYKAWYLKLGKELVGADQIASRGRCHLLLQPAGWPYPNYLRGIPQSAELPF
ncbi:MAG: FkbM family methyltransferase [Cyclobacteriaceae bacterium]